MWWVKDEEGATAITVALMLLVVFGIGALVLDAGNLFWERRQLQNAADAAALAAAQDYALGMANTAEQTARTYASVNNTRGAFVEEYEHDLAAKTVTVTTRTGDEDAPGVLVAWLAGILGHDEYFTRASATARWGGIGRGTTIPIAMCEHAWEHFTTDGSKLPSGPPAHILRVGVPPGHILEDVDCSNPGDGDVPPGGFAFLTADGNCMAEVDEFDWMDGDTGSQPDITGNSPCTETAFYDMLIEAIDSGGRLLIPIFDVYEDQGSHGRYHIIGFGALKLEGYTINSGPQHPIYGRSYKWSPGPSACPGSASCLLLYFTEFIALDGVFPPDGGGDEHGASLVTLIR